MHVQIVVCTAGITNCEKAGGTVISAKGSGFLGQTHPGSNKLQRTLTLEGQIAELLLTS